MRLESFFIFRQFQTRFLKLWETILQIHHHVNLRHWCLD